MLAEWPHDALPQKCNGKDTDRYRATEAREGVGEPAEGGETEAQKALLIAHGCDLYQGYLLARPMPVADFERTRNSGAA